MQSFILHNELDREACSQKSKKLRSMESECSAFARRQYGASVNMWPSVRSQQSEQMDKLFINHYGKKHVSVLEINNAQ